MSHITWFPEKQQNTNKAACFLSSLDLSARVDAVKEENLKLKSENQVLGQYIENLMSASSVFQTTDTKGKRKWCPQKSSEAKRGRPVNTERGLFLRQAQEFTTNLPEF